MSMDSLDRRQTPHEAAAWWLNQRRSGDMTPEDAQAFEAWLEANPANRAAWQELDGLWTALGAVADDPRLMAACEADARRYRLRRGVRWGALAACVLALAGGGWWFSMQDVGLPLMGPGGPAEFQTSVGQRTTVTLPDRSVVTLDTDTVLRVHDKPGERLVTLKRGRAFFRVAKDPNRPFIVAAGGHRVRAIGTAFDVSVAPKRFEVTLIEGKVKVETPSPLRLTATSAALQPGQRLAIADSKPRLSRVDLRAETTWHDGRLTFARDSLADAVAEMNRYSDKKIVFAGGNIPDKSIVGVFRAGDVDSFARAVSMDGVAKVTAQTDEYIELSIAEKNVGTDPSLPKPPASF